MLLYRKPIFDRKHKVCGYELIYDLPSGVEGLGCSKEDMDWFTLLASVSVMASGFGDGRILVNYPLTEKSDIESVLSKDLAVLRFGPELDSDERRVLGRLREKGYPVAVDHEADADIQMDIGVVKVEGKNIDELKKYVEQLRAEGIESLAVGVNSMSSYKQCIEAGFDYFKGDFFRENRLLSSDKLTSNQVSRLELFTMLESDDCDFEELSRAIEKDVSISYRLIGLLNSPSFGFANKVSSVRQAVTLAGWQALRRWLRLAILTDIDPTPRGEHICYASAQRGRFLELVSQRLGFEKDRDSFFLLGLLSLLDVLLDLPMNVAIADIPIDENISRALCHEKSPYRKWLGLVESLEESDWERFRIIATKVALDTDAVNEDYFDSVMWANTFFYG